MGDIISALNMIFVPLNLLGLFFGVLVGIAFGCMPGLSVNMGLALLFPLAFTFHGIGGILMLLGIYCGAIYGGSISAILLKTPGTPASVATTLDGYPMATKMGQPGRALGLSTMARTFGGVFSTICLILLAPQLAKVALQFSKPEYFALAIFGLSIITSVSSGSVIKGIMGGLFGLFLKLLMPKKRSKDNRLIISVSLIFAFCGICALLDVSPLLGCMSMGTVYINITNDEKLFKQLNYFTPPILLLFFVRSGLSFRLDALVNNFTAVGNTPLLVIGVVYFVVRIVGKYAGAFLGCLITGKPKEVRNYLGLALIPQAGVAIGLAALGARTLGGETGVALETVILSSSVLYELVGPACAKLSLYLSKSYSNKIEDIVPVEELDECGKPISAVELLIQRIQVIQAELPHNTVSEEEQAFLEAAEDQIAALSSIQMRGRRG